MHLVSSASVFRLGLLDLGKLLQIGGLFLDNRFGHLVSSTSVDQLTTPAAVHASDHAGTRVRLFELDEHGSLLVEMGRPAEAGPAIR